MATVDTVLEALGDKLHQFDWLNLGGGYLFDNLLGADTVAGAMRRLSADYGLEVTIEPGAAVTHDAAYFVTSVEDILERPDRSLALVDFSVNHWPELFEYQRQPMIEESDDTGAHTFHIAGCSCLAGDTLGEYTFKEPLCVGDRLHLSGAGAYSLGKAHTFNGINLPNIYILSSQGDLQLIKQYSFEEFASACCFSPENLEHATDESRVEI